MWTKRRFIKIISMCMAVLFLLVCFPLSGLVETAFATGGEDLQALIDATPSGGTLTLTKDYTGKGKFTNEFVNITKPITIKGPSGSYVTVNMICLNIESDNVTIKNLHFEKSADDIGVIRCLTINASYKNLTVENCVFNFEKNKNAFGEKRIAWTGNAIELHRLSNATIKSCTFKYCYAQEGGGAVYLNDADNCEIVSCTFENNQASCEDSDNGGLGVGGAVYIKNTDGAEISNCTFDDNYAVQYGGAIFFTGSKNISVKSCTFWKDDSTPSYAIVSDLYGMGGAIAMKNSKNASVSSCTFECNTAYMGAGIFASESSLTVGNSTFVSNEVDRKTTVSADLMYKILETTLTVLVLDPQGIIELLANYALTAATCPHEFAAKFTEGTGKIGGEGGGIYVIDSTLKVTGSWFSKNDAEKLGGAIYAAGDSAKTTEISGSIFRYNTSDSGGGAIANLMPGMVVDNCSINYNTSEAGGGLYSVAGCTVKNTSFKYDTASLGGAVCANAIDNTQTYQDCVFDTNDAKSGGAMYAHGYSEDSSGTTLSASKCNVNMTDCAFKNNSATYYGGALSLYCVSVRMNDTDFTSNTAVKEGGAMYIVDDCDVVTAWCDLTGNTSDIGGAVYNSLSYLKLEFGKFKNNVGNTGAGVIYDYKGATTLDNGLFTGNKTKNKLLTNGSVLYLNATKSCSVTNCTIVNNYPSVSEPVNNMSAIYLKGGAKLKLRNNIILSNTQTENISDRDITVSSGCTVDAKYNMCALSGTGNIEGTIGVFESAGGNDNYDLGYGYMYGYLGAVEKGTTDISLYAQDLNGNTRVIDNDGNGTRNIDLGCYEQQYVRITIKLYNSLTGTISGETEQWILRGTKPDYSALTITPAEGYEFDHWETSSGVTFDENAVFYYGRTVYAVLEKKQISISFEYDKTKLTIADAGSGTIESAGGNMERFVMSVPYYTYPTYPTMKGINGWEFAGWSSASAPATSAKVVTASAKATATYDFGSYGYYDDGDTQSSTWVTNDCNPLESPAAGNIKVNTGKKFVGWSDTEGGSVISLPASITEPTVYYAVYDVATVHLSVNGGAGTVINDPSGDYDYGTKINLSSTTSVIPPAGSYFIGFTDASGDPVDLSELFLTEDITITAQYAAVPTGTLTIKTDTDKGVIDTTVAGAMGFSGTTAQVTKAASITGAEDLFSMISPQGVSDFAGFTVESSSGGDLTLVAEYKFSLCKLMVILSNAFNPLSTNYTGGSGTSTVALSYEQAGTVVLLSTGGAVDFSAYGYYAYGTVIDLSTIPVYPDTGYRFVGWQDGSGQFVTSVTLTADTQVYAVFEKITYTLTVLKSGGGSIDTALPGTYDYGDVASLDAGYATADSGYTFAGYKDESGNFISSILMNGDKTVTAVFKPDSCAVTLESDGNGFIDGDCHMLTETGVSIDLASVTCTPDEGYVFSHWENEAGETVSASYTVTGNQTLTAVFDPISYSLNVTCQSGGSVSEGLAGSYAQDSTVYLCSDFAQPDSGYMFSGFVDENGNDITSVTMDADKTVTVQFAVQQYPLNIYTKTDDGIIPYSVQWYASGTTVELSSISVSVSGMSMKGWLNENLDSVSSVTINSETTVYAEFIKKSSAADEDDTEDTDEDDTEDTEPDTISPVATPVPSVSAEPEVSPTPEISVTPAPEQTEEAQPVAEIPDTRGLSWYWWLVIGAGAVVAGGVMLIIYRLKKNKRKKRMDIF